MSTTINKNLGHVTAYAYAKAGGYTGTEAEFQTLLGNIAIDLSEIENLSVVVTTLPAGSDATARYEDGKIYLGVPRGDTGEISEADLATTLEDYAQVDGYYSDMTVGDAEQLISSMYVEDAEPYGYRTTGGSADVGNREYVDAIVGGTVNWNQLVSHNKASFSQNGVSLTNNGDGSWTISGTATASVWAVLEAFSYPQGAGRVLLYWFGAKSVSGQYRFLDTNRGSGNYDAGGEILKPAGISSNIQVGVNVTSGASINVTVKPMFFDLTAMFGSTIADYIYGLEQANAGAGVAFFKKLFPKDYYEYNAGELISVSGLQSHDMVGFNQWDEEWEVGIIRYDHRDANWGQNVNGGVNDIRSKNYIPAKGNTTYFLTTPSTTYALFYDASKNPLMYSPTQGYVDARNKAFTTPPGTSYIRFYCLSYGTTYNHDICVNLSWSGWRNGEYESYQKYSYPLDSSLTLRGIPKLDAQNNLYFDGDEYLPSGVITRKHGLITFTGVESWGFSNNFFYVNVLPSGIAKADFNRVLTSNGTVALVNGGSGQMRVYLEDNPSLSSSSNLNVVFDSGSVAQYELATPTTETAELYQHIQICDDFGIEEYVSTSIVPVGHNTRYPANLRDKLQHMPNLADNDGAYLIRQTNKQMSLELFRIPKAPTTDGTYTLKATVSGGTPTYTWEAEE